MNAKVIPVIAENTGMTCIEVLWLYLTYMQIKHDIPYSEVNGSQCVLDAENKIINYKLTKELFDKYEAQDEILIPVEVSNVEEWIQEYRNLFKGKCTTVTPMGNRQHCIERMKWFLYKYPEYADKELILEATKWGINQIETKYKSKGFGDVPQADNFICKLSPVYGNIQSKKVYDYLVEKEYLVTFCEIIKDLKADGKNIEVIEKKLISNKKII